MGMHVHEIPTRAILAPLGRSLALLREHRWHPSLRSPEMRRRAALAVLAAWIVAAGWAWGAHLARGGPAPAGEQAGAALPETACREVNHFGGTFWLPASSGAVRPVADARPVLWIPEGSRAGERLTHLRGRRWSPPGIRLAVARP